MDRYKKHKEIVGRYRAALYDFDADALRGVLGSDFAADVVAHMAYPMGDLVGGDAVYDRCFAPLVAAMPDLERRDWIVMAGTTQAGQDWVGCAGHYVGTFVAPWLDILPSGHLTHMRFHEFFRIEAGRVVEMQCLWDIPEVMMQARAWPMAPSLGREFCVPGPATLDGVMMDAQDVKAGQASCDLVVDMLGHMVRHPKEGGPEVMEMDQFWHPKMNWYGPAGIGTGRGISGFRNWHQIPFLRAMPDRGQHDGELTFHFFGEGNYAAVTGWPNMVQTLTQGGWMGIAPANKEITISSLDFWRIENGKIRENWVLLDVLDVSRQVGVDVFARMREFNKARVHGAIPFPVGDN